MTLFVCVLFPWTRPTRCRLNELIYTQSLLVAQ